MIRRLALLAALVAAPLLAPRAALAGPGDFLVGVEVHAPWTAGIRLEWQPLELLEPSLSFGFAPRQGAATEYGGDAVEGTLAVAFRITTQPFPIIGLSFSGAVRGFIDGQNNTIPGLELGIGWRLRLLGLEFMAEVGGMIGEQFLGPYLGLGIFFVFD